MNARMVRPFWLALAMASGLLAQPPQPPIPRPGGNAQLPGAPPPNQNAPAAQPPAQPLKIKFLEVWQRVRSEFVCPKERQHLLRARITLIDTSVVGAKML